MPLHPTLTDICFRIALGFLAGIVVGLNRGERNEAAGLRTTILVCMAACFAGVLANLLLSTTGKAQGDFAQIDVLRLPLGILSGIGFIGAGAIIKKQDVALGVTTAATMWFMSVVGLCFGLGLVALGVTATALGLVTLWLLRWLDTHMRRAMRATLVVEADGKHLEEEELRSLLTRDYTVIAWSTQRKPDSQYCAKAVLQWKGHQSDAAEIPRIIGLLKVRAGVASAAWTPAEIAD